jgi:hypothetical protein
MEAMLRELRDSSFQYLLLPLFTQVVARHRYLHWIIAVCKVIVGTPATRRSAAGDL